MKFLDKKIDINIKQIVKQSGEKDTFNIHTTGTYHEKQNDIIRYQEIVDDKAVNNTIKLGNNDIRIHRSGTVKTTFHFIEGKETVSYYDTNYGRMTLTVKTLSIKREATNKQGKIKIHYQLIDDTGLLGTYQYYLNYKEINE